MRRLTLHTNSGGTFEIPADRVLANNVTLPGEYNPHNVKLWAIYNEYGYLGCVWADCEQDAFDELVDADLGAALLCDEPEESEDEDDESEDITRLGNDGSPANLDNAGLTTVKLTPELCALFLAARESGEATL